MINNFKAFLDDETAWEMFISGQAGTGKTTLLHDLVLHCMVQEIPYVVCAYTHNACGILREKLPINAEVQTLHAFLKKRPGVNDTATKREHVTVSSKTGDSERKTIMLLDEYSMVGDKDYTDIGWEQDPQATGIPEMKVLYLGDPNQLPPVGDTPSVYPSGEYNYTLTHIYRQAGDNPLIETLTQLVGYIDGTGLPIKPLTENDSFTRGVNLIEAYNNDDCCDNVLLAFTNKRVQELNFQIQGANRPYERDFMYSPTLRHHYYFYNTEEDVSYIDRVFGDQLAFGSKYKTLEHLVNMGESGTLPTLEFMNVVDEDDNECTYAVVFGHYNYKCALENLQEAAVSSNKAIESHTTVKAKVWAAAHPHTPLARARSKAWRDYMTFKDCVVCMDFPYAMTVHKSQGSTFDTVYVDTKDLSICADKNYSMYLKLLYVAISRASNMVYTN